MLGPAAANCLWGCFHISLVLLLSSLVHQHRWSESPWVSLWMAGLMLSTAVDLRGVEHLVKWEDVERHPDFCCNLCLSTENCKACLFKTTSNYMSDFSSKAVVLLLLQKVIVDLGRVVDVISTWIYQWRPYFAVSGVIILTVAIINTCINSAWLILFERGHM